MIVDHKSGDGFARLHDTEEEARLTIKNNERIARAEQKRQRKRVRNLNRLLKPDGPKWELLPNTPI